MAPRQEKPEPGRSRAAIKLAKILDESGPTAKRLRAEFGRVTLWRWAVGERTPEAKNRGNLRKLTRGRLSFEAWDQTAQG
jgi:hypothetical protein